MIEGFSITTRQDLMDRDVIYAFLSRSYWAQGISRETLGRALDNSLCFGVMMGEGRQVGFARMITDTATYAYLADVFILDEFRGRGLSRWLLQTLLDHPDLQGLRRITLATQDAHGLYEKFGFKRLAKPEIFMEIWSPEVDG